MNKPRMTVLKAFGKVVREVRRRKGLSIEEVARRSGIEVARLRAIERGEADTDLVQVTHMAKGLGMEASVTLTASLTRTVRRAKKSRGANHPARKNGDE